MPSMEIPGNASARWFPLRVQRSVTLRAAPDMVFAFLDVHENITGHMDRPTWAMLGGYMRTTLDAFAGKQIGSVIEVSGKVLGMSISLVEEVVRRVPPLSKQWQTVGVPQLLVIGGYRMGFDVEPVSEGCRVTVFIDYELPRAQPQALLGRLLGPAYARWCVNRVIDTVTHSFAGTEARRDS
jgi:hypothetical protein